MRLARTLRVAAAAAALVLALNGCSDQLGDRGGSEGAEPDKISDVNYIEVYRNADNFPNMGTDLHRRTGVRDHSESGGDEFPSAAPRAGVGSTLPTPTAGVAPSLAPDCILRSSPPALAASGSRR